MAKELPSLTEELTRLSVIEVIEVDGTEYRLEMTCGACPEQYDVFHGGSLVGYLRLRHGFFTADAPDAEGETVYSTSTDGDGAFEEHERGRCLRAAVERIHEFHADPGDGTPSDRPECAECGASPAGYAISSLQPLCIPCAEGWA